MTNNPIMILNGDLIFEQEATVSPVNRGLMYGDGCFETLRLYEATFLHWDTHFDRLISGLQYLGMKPNFTSEGLKKAITQLAEKNHLSETQAMVRLQCWRKGERGYKPSSKELNWMAQISKISPKITPLKLTVAGTRCIPNQSLDRRFKLSNGLNYIKGAQEASAKNVDDALMLTINDEISETTSANIFWVKDSTVFTPNVECDLLPGVTRSIVLRVCERAGIVVEKGKFSLKQFETAEAVFCTNSLIEIRQVSDLDGKEFQVDHPVTERIKSGFEVYKREHLQK